jgi:hypothetical protein
MVDASELNARERSNDQNTSCFMIQVREKVFENTWSVVARMRVVRMWLQNFVSE